ncbi:SDR family NAD(P)-dependent oxidoreductase [Geomesophilobacter sediminis]|uniref:SDR family oxidoreductase n=1 Tax=Geomesophilobacter sediminis TaxID=2798584 RepID=A0A8J7M267_9BACT|nr:SDR family oxidoreductase [Geomesophilobacter sediminis]MBJ6727354.1 SDR family oxidoreductase [Geomesophilobacter sediminis]
MRIAIVTGGNRGVGKATALSLAERGTGIILTYNTHREEAEAVVAQIKSGGGKAVALPLDVARVDSFDAFAREVSVALEKEWNQKSFDYLVNNAGTAQRTLMKDLTEAQFDGLVDVHFKGVFFLTQKLIPLMADGGHVIFVSSALTRVTYPNGVAVYAAVKGAIEVLTRYVAAEYAGRKIRANCVAPGALDTDFGGGRTDAQREAIGEHTLLGRIGTAEDIGPVIASLLSEENGWVNAQRIEVSGGM